MKSKRTRNSSGGRGGPAAGGSTFVHMTDNPVSGTTPGLMHVAAPPARKYADTGTYGLCVHGFWREGP
jgi:hypothetical protein